jgi:hypothetical protein
VVAYPDLGKERDASSAVAGHGSSIAEDEPPACVALILGDCTEQVVGLGVGEREQS